MGKFSIWIIIMLMFLEDLLLFFSTYGILQVNDIVTVLLIPASMLFISCYRYKTVDESKKKNNHN